MAALTPIFVIIYSVLKGRPTRFEVIAKSNAVMNREYA
jgi:hypothetical protein